MRDIARPEREHARCILGAPDDAAPLLVVRYTQRQRAAVENIRFVLDEALTGRVGDARRRGPRVRGRRRAPRARRAGARVADASRRVMSPAAQLSRALPSSADRSALGGGGHHARESHSAVPRGLPDRPRGAAGAGRTLRRDVARRHGVDRGGGDGAAATSCGRRPRTCACGSCRC